LDVAGGVSRERKKKLAMEGEKMRSELLLPSFPLAIESPESQRSRDTCLQWGARLAYSNYKNSPSLSFTFFSYTSIILPLSLIILHLKIILHHLTHISTTTTTTHPIIIIIIIHRNQ